jgi:hypothetical protein
VIFYPISISGKNDVDWLTRLRRWIKKIFRGTKRHIHHPTIIKRWYGANCAVLRLERQTQGAVATYRIIPRRGGFDYLLTLDYLPELQAELVGVYDGTPIKIRWYEHPRNDAVAHRFAVWEIYPNGNSHALGVWDVDMEGSAGGALKELAPKRAILGVALRSLQIVNSSKTPDMSWQAQMARIDWLGLLSERIRQELSNPSHNIKACSVLPKS